MNLPDASNGAFEAIGGLLQIRNCFVLWQHKKVWGVDWRVTAFFTLWGLWNLFYYPHLGQWLSTAGGVVIVLANIVWVSGAIHFRSLK